MTEVLTFSYVFMKIKFSENKLIFFLKLKICITLPKIKMLIFGFLRKLVFNSQCNKRNYLLSPPAPQEYWQNCDRKLARWVAFLIRWYYLVCLVISDVMALAVRNIRMEDIIPWKIGKYSYILKQSWRSSKTSYLCLQNLYEFESMKMCQNIMSLK